MHDQSYAQAPVPNPAAYPSAPSPYGAPEPERRRTGLLVAIAVVAALLVVATGLLLGPLRSGSSTEAAEAAEAQAIALRSAQGATPGSVPVGQVPTGVEVPTSVPGAPAPASTPKAPAPVSAPTPAPSGGSNGSPSAPQPQAPSAPAPVITSFTTPENIDCHNGDFQTFSASWTTTNATKTMISIDGPGGYKTYGPNDSDSLPFNCSSPHTFLLTAYGHDGSTVTRSITLQPRNVQVPDTGDDEGDPSSAPAPASSPDDEI